MEAPPATSPGGGSARPASAAPMTAPVGVPGCSVATAAAPVLRTVSTSMEPVPGTPFGVAVTADGRWSFISLPGTGSVGGYRIGESALPSLARQVYTGTQLLGEALTRDGGYLLAADDGGGAAVISVRRAETDPAASVVSSGDAGCSPVRVITSADGSVVWVTARESDRLLGFSAARLRTDPARSLITSTQVGEAPVGLALVDGGTRIVVADSNRFSASGATSGLAVVDVPAAGQGKPALLGYLRAGGFPREMALEPGGRTLLVTNFGSQQLEAVGVADLP